MTATPRRTLTVTSGRETLGFINEMGRRNFVALVAASGQKLGPFATQAEAALAIRAACKPTGGAHE